MPEYDPEKEGRKSLKIAAIGLTGAGIAHGINKHSVKKMTEHHLNRVQYTQKHIELVAKKAPLHEEFAAYKKSLQYAKKARRSNMHSAMAAGAREGLLAGAAFSAGAAGLRFAEANYRKKHKQDSIWAQGFETASSESL